MRLGSHPGRAIPGVVFAEDFDDPPAGPDPEPPAPDPVEVAAAIEPAGEEPPAIDTARLVSEARDEGFAAGVRTVEAGLEAQKVALLASLGLQLADIAAEASAVTDRRMETIAKAAMSIVLSCVPSIAARFAEDELRLALQHVLPRLGDEAHVAVTVNPGQEALARATIADAFGQGIGSRVRVTVGAAPSLAPGDMRVAWQDGSAVRDLSDSLGQLRARLRALDLLAALDEETHDVERG